MKQPNLMSGSEPGTLIRKRLTKNEQAGGERREIGRFIKLSFSAAG
ncbi:MAG TPA: hypothetical protein VJN43_16835 [Bryobacteraceae bacterium]|nr:hypothetical protein [Bryobacteraceae bacterium]